MKEFIYLLVGIDVIISVASWFYFPKWWMRIWDVSHLYLLFFTALLLILVIWLIPGWLLSKSIIITLLLCIVVLHVIKMIPYTPFYPKEVTYQAPNLESFTLLSINVLKENNKYGDFINIINKLNPDIILIIEYTPAWEAYLKLNLHNYPHQRALARADGFGLALYSKIKLSQAEMIYLVDKETPSIHALIHLPSEVIYFVGMHPKPPVPWMKNATEAKDVATVLLADMLQAQARPALVAGDFNDVSWSTLMTAFKEASGLRDPRIGRGFYNTYHARKFYIRYPIDHIFLDPRFRLSRFRRVRLPGSDHFGLFIQLQLINDK
ncbi:MAG: endonuclease/exonuclease/phosphatase family protein [Saprospiraceae bacterium]